MNAKPRIMGNGELQATITDVQRFSLHDGKGLRTIVFFKGCPLRCPWCQNPETQNAWKQLMLTWENCIHCGACLTVCPHTAIRVDENGPHIARERCVVCGACTEVCYAEALRIVGRKVSMEDLLAVLMRDSVFYQMSGGGVTLSGGDPLSQIPFARELMRRLKAAGVHTAIETSAACDSSQFQSLAQYADSLLIDVKHCNASKHRFYTGHDNAQILQNLIWAGSTDKELVLRVPLLPGINDDEKNIERLSVLAGRVGAAQIHILPFHQLGASKWERLGMPYMMENTKPHNPEDLRRIRSILERHGHIVNIGGYGE